MRKAQEQAAARAKAKQEAEAAAERARIAAATRAKAKAYETVQQTAELKQAADAAGKVATAVAVGGKQLVKHASKGMIDNAVSPLKRATPLHNDKLKAVTASQAKGPDAKAALAAAEKTFVANSKTQTMTNLKDVDSTVGKATSVGFVGNIINLVQGGAAEVAETNWSSWYLN